MQPQVIQHCVNYTAEDHEIWSVLFKKHFKTRTERASREYLNSLHTLKMTQHEIPDVTSINNELMDLTGWSLQLVEGLVPEEAFFKLLYQRKFPVVNYIRPMESLDYFDVPDLFHDLYAHVPLLANSNYCMFLKGLSEIAAEHDHDEYVINLVSRVYWYAIETGLIFEDDELKIYGAAVLSSRKESENVYSADSKKHAYNVATIIDTPYNYNLQTKYFVINSFEELYQSIEEIREEAEKRICFRRILTGNTYYPSAL